MPKTDAPYIIGVIREKEKQLLQADEYTRLIDAPSIEASAQSLVETVYGPSFEQTDDALQALPHHLQKEREWLSELITDERVLNFIHARYTALANANTENASLEDIAQEVSKTLHDNAHTPLMRALADLFDARQQADVAFRNQEPLPADATQYEKDWDEQILTLLRQYRDEPVGYDPILAYWYAKEIEARTIRLLLIAKTNKIPNEAIHSLVRSLYLANP